MIVEIESVAIAALSAIALAQYCRAQKLSRCPVYGILTRAAAEARPPRTGAVVFWDIDAMHALNERYGYEGVNRRISDALAQVRASRNCRLLARWFSGDEFIYCCPDADADAAATRIQDAFVSQGISITIGICSIDSDWIAAVQCAAALVQEAKAGGDRGSVRRSQ